MPQDKSWKEVLISLVRITLYSIILFFIGLFIYMGVSYKKLPECAKETLLENIQKLNDEKIVKIEVAIGHSDYNILPKFTLNDSDINIFIDYLKHVDSKPIGGHNHTDYDCYITFFLEPGVKQIYYGGIYTQYDWNKDALYLSYPYVSKDGKYWYRGQGENVRVPGLGKWLSEKYPKIKKE